MPAQRRRRGVLPRRSPGEWSVRVALALAAAWLGWISVTYSLALSLRSRLPETAYALAPWHARVAGSYAAALSGGEATLEQRAEADRIARDALRRDPTVVAAVSTLGVNAAVRGDEAQARRLFAYSTALSRRDLRTRLWLIEDAVARGDVAGALRHYDIALRTSRQAPDLLFPVLSAAIDEPRIQAELTRTLQSQPAWSEAFVGHVAGVGEPRAVAALFGRFARAGVPVPASARPPLIGRLVSVGEVDAAWSYYASTGKGADRRRSRDPRFTAALDHPTAFDWATVQDGGASATIQRGEDGGIVDFFAPATVGGPVLVQQQLLPPGEYLIEGRSADIEQPPLARPYWLLACSDGRELGRVVLPNSPDTGARFSGRVTVPANCPAQALLLIARPSDEIGGSSGRILEAQLRPAR